MAPGSDNWPVTWADDDRQYTAWGDGGGFGGTNNSGRVSLGFARVEGDRENYRGENVWGGLDAPNAAAFNGKSYGIISIGGVLYAWQGPGTATVNYEPAQEGGEERTWSGRTIYNKTQLLVSYDKGETWAKSGWDMTDVDDRLIMPTILNFGRDYAGARDSYVYHYFVRKEPTGPGLTIHKGGNPATGKIDLARVPQTALMELSAYEFFAGMDECGDARWTQKAANRQPAFEDENGVGWTASVSYNAGLDRYILATEHTKTAEGRLGLFEANEPWGPWHEIASFDAPGFGAGAIEENTFFWNFSNKWLSKDGRRFVLVFTGTHSNDSWNTVEGEFLPEE